MSWSKTEYMSGDESVEKVKDRRLQGLTVVEEIKIKYLLLTMQEVDGAQKKKEPQERKRAGWNGWRRVSRVIIDWRTAAEPAVMYSSKTVGLSERQWPGWTGLQMSGSEGQLFSTYRSDIQLESQSEDGLCVWWGQGRRWDFGTGGHQTCQMIFASFANWLTSTQVPNGLH